MAGDETIAINVPEQGVDLILLRDAALGWFDLEIQFVNEMSGAISEAVQWGDRSFNNSSGHSTALRMLQQARQALSSANDIGPLNSYLQDARNLQVVLAHGVIGERVRALLKSGAKEEARWVLLIFGGKWTAASGNLNAMLAPLRAASIGDPALLGATDVNTATVAMERATEAQQRSDETANNLQELLQQKQSLFTQLEQLYREQLTVTEPAVLWENAAISKRRRWRFALWVFGVLVLVPFVTAGIVWEPLTAGIVKITGNSVFSISGLALITIPTLLYGWLLKNVARIFLQNLMLSDDAEHRRALSLTYLGLMANPEHGMERKDRAIILNALFRPIPPHAGEEGPPSGLIELIKGRVN